MTDADLIAIIRARKGVGGKVRRDIERAMGWRKDDWYRAWPVFGAQLEAAYRAAFVP